MEEEKIDVVEEVTEEKKEGKFKAWCKKHPDVVLTVAGGLAGLVGGILKLWAVKSEYEDNLYTTVDEEVYKIPARKMKTAKHVTTRKK